MSPPTVAKKHVLVVRSPAVFAAGNAMSRFHGHIRDLGEVSWEAIRAVTERLSTSDHMWLSEETRFSTAIPSAQHIILKFPDNYPHSHVPASYKPVWWEWEDLLAPIIARVAQALGFASFDTSKVMFTRLNPSGRIPTHIDENPSSAIPHKIHVPLMTDPRTVFRVEDGTYHLPVGRAYEINNLLPHSVENNSDTVRVHFIFDCFPDDRTAVGV